MLLSSCRNLSGTIGILFFELVAAAMLLFARRSINQKYNIQDVRLLIVSSVFLTLAIVAVALRCVARRFKGLRLAADDYWIALALV